MNARNELLAELIRREQEILETRCRFWELCWNVSADHPAGAEERETGEKIDRLLRNYKSWLKRNAEKLRSADLYIDPPR